MKNRLPFAALIVGIATASCSSTSMAPMMPSSISSNGSAPAAGAGMSADRLAQSVGVVSGSWATTATQAVPLRSMSKTALLTSAIPSSVQLHVVVGLAMTNRTGAEELVRRQNTPGDAYFHKYLTPSQFTAQFNPPASEAQAVASYLTKEGFTNVTVEPNNLMVSAYGPAAVAANAFHTTIQGTTVNGQLTYGNTTAAEVPAQFHGQVLAVLGLTNAYQMHGQLLKSTTPRLALASATTASVGTGATTDVTKAANTPPPCLTVTATGVCEFGEYGPKQYQVAYNAASYDTTGKGSPCTKTSCTGSNTSIAVIAEGNVSQVVTDLRTAENYWGLPQVPFSVQKVGISSVDTSGLDEWDLDTQISSGIAQTVKHLYIYDTTSLTDSDIALAYSHWVNDDLAQAGNSSFGELETDAYADGSMLVDDEEFNQGAAQGQTMFASTSDNGSGCAVIASTGVPNTGVPEPCYPSVSPYVVAVGGTTLDTNAVGGTAPCTDCGQPGTYYGEHVWVGTGGGYSKYETAPYWQANGICAACTPDATRGIADVAMCADNNGCPMVVFVNGASEGVGGTSLASPMSMGMWARLETSFANTLGFAPPVYYGVYGYYEPCPLGSTACTPTGFPANDTSALPPDTTLPIGGFNNILFGTNGAPSVATPGWNEPTGMGSVNFGRMLSDIGNSIFSGH